MVTVDARPPLARRLVWVPVGMGCVVLGGIGLAVPGLPATVFFIAAAAAFSRSSPRLERWLLNLRVVGPLVQDYRAGRGMPRRAKVVAVAMIVVSVGLSALAFERPVAQVALVALGAVGVVAVLRVRGRPPEPIEPVEPG